MLVFLQFPMHYQSLKNTGLEGPSLQVTLHRGIGLLGQPFSEFNEHHDHWFSKCGPWTLRISST